MRRIAPLLALLLLFTADPLFAQSAHPTAPAETPTAFERPELVETYQKTITPADLAAYLYVYASDAFAGRETTTPGQKLAARYLAGQYRKLGLEPKGTLQTSDPYAPEAYFQPFTVYGQRLQGATLTATEGGEKIASAAFSADEQGDVYLQFGSMEEAAGGVVFAGYGIDDEALSYSDYAAMQEQGLDPSGKWILILRDEPLENDSTSLLATADGAPSRWTTDAFAKYRPLFQNGAKGLLVVGDTGPRGEDVSAAAQQAAAALGGVGSLSLDSTGSGRQYPPLYVVSTDFANELLAPSGQTVQTLQQQINRSLDPEVFALRGVRLSSRLDMNTYAAQTENVLAYLEGSDPQLKKEVVVITSHLDHIGTDPTRTGDQINNGADDDGTGTVAMLEMAEAFKKAKDEGYGPRRSLLFLHVTGEEKGLLGSEYYTDQEPVFPLDSTAVNLNIDMIGRSDPTRTGASDQYVYLIGSAIISEDLDQIIRQVNTETGTDLELDDRFNTKDDPNQFYRRSDHWNFGKHNIPFTFFFTGTHADYHDVGDEAHKIRYDNLARITRLIYATAWQVANQDARPEVSGQGFN